MKSFSEIETTSKRASRAVGFSWGESEEIGKCIRLLELFGLPGIKSLNQYYQSRKKEKFKDLKLIEQNNNLDGESLCPITLGVSFLDQIKKLETFKNIKFQLGDWTGILDTFLHSKYISPLHNRFCFFNNIITYYICNTCFRANVSSKISKMA